MYIFVFLNCIKIAPFERTKLGLNNMQKLSVYTKYGLSYTHWNAGSVRKTSVVVRGCGQWVVDFSDCVIMKYPTPLVCVLFAASSLLPVQIY